MRKQLERRKAVLISPPATFDSLLQDYCVEALRYSQYGGYTMERARLKEKLRRALLTEHIPHWVEARRQKA